MLGDGLFDVLEPAFEAAVREPEIWDIAGGISASGREELFDWRERRRWIVKKNRQAPILASARIETPTPIPALAPVDKPWELDVEFEVPVAIIPLLPVRIADDVPVVAAQ